MFNMNKIKTRVNSVIYYISHLKVLVVLLGDYFIFDKLIKRKCCALFS
jgi:hypothetical protein